MKVIGMTGRVNIILSTYNGKRFLPELLESLSSQSYPDLLVSIRDDCSTDGTFPLLSAWAASRPNILASRGERLGPAKSFFHLLHTEGSDCEYFAFCDQDDVWLPDKMEWAVAALQAHSADVPALYCSAVEYVDAELHHIGYSKVPKRIGFANALVENIAAGCTTVLNRRARDLVCERIPQNARHHDWWCYQAISALGKVIFDDKPTVRYRQHTNNQIGVAQSQVDLFRQRLTRLLRLGNGARLLSDQALEFKRCFGDALSDRDRETLDSFLSVRGGLAQRISYNANMDVWRQSWADTILLRGLILMGRV